MDLRYGYSSSVNQNQNWSFPLHLLMLFAIKPATEKNYVKSAVETKIYE